MKVYVLERGMHKGNDGIVGVFAERRLAVDEAMVQKLPFGHLWGDAVASTDTSVTDAWRSAWRDELSGPHWMTITEYELVGAEAATEKTT